MSDLSTDHARVHNADHTEDELDLRWRQAGARLRKNSPEAYAHVRKILGAITAEPQSPAREADSGIMRAGIVRDVKKHLEEPDECGVGFILQAIGEALVVARASHDDVAPALLHLLALLDDDGIDEVLRTTIEQAKILREHQREDKAKRPKVKRVRRGARGAR